jgi:hypothetical protein
MNWKIIIPARGLSALLLLVTLAAAQTTSSQPAAAPPVSYASVSQLNGMLTPLEQASQTAQGDLSKLRIEHWKTDSNTKRQTQADVESIQRNLQGALPAIITDLRSSPESLPSTFKLYRNLDALYDVLVSVVESAGAFGSKDEFQSLQNDLSSVEKARHSFADRMETLAGSKETELARLRAQVQTAQAVANPPQPKKIIVDDTAPTPPKKTVKKKPVPKPAAASTNAGSTPATSAPKQ